MKTIVACGCSITHGAETFNKFMHPKNAQLAYPAWIGRRLMTNVDNRALSGGSNDDIFHAAMDAVKNQNLHSLIVAWTSPERLHWIDDDRHWFFIPGWASSMKNLESFAETSYCRTHDGQLISADEESLLDTLEEQHKFFVTNYFTKHEQHVNKVKNYSLALNDVCQQRQIKLVEIQALHVEQSLGYFFDPHGLWRHRPGAHPTVDEHRKIAEEIIEKFYR